MSLRIVRSLTPSRCASSGPGQSGRACSRDSSASIRAEVSCTKRNLSFLIGLYRSPHDSEHPPLPRRHPAGRPGRPRRPPGPHPAPPARPRRRLGLRRAQPLPGRDGRALAHGVRLARAGGADQRLPALPHRDRRPDDPLPARAVRRARRHAAAARPHLPGLVPRLPRHDRAARATAVLRLGHPLDAGLRLQHAGGRPRLDDGPGRAHLRHADAPPRLRQLRHPRQRRRRDGRARARPPRPARLPRRARAAPVLVPVRRPGRVREPGARRLRGPRAPAVVPVRRRLQRDQRLPPADRGRRHLRLPGRASSPGTSCSTPSATARAW